MSARVLTAPFPWFGGKSRAADLIWPRFGNVPNYIEPFAGSLSVLLARPHQPQVETVNDRDAYLANFWRAVQADPTGVARECDWPVSEADLHARHLWLIAQRDFRERMLTDPDYFDVKIAGWWVWGLSSWIGSGWCDLNERTNERTNKEQAQSQGAGAWRWTRHPSRQLPAIADAARGVHRPTDRPTDRPPSRQLPVLRGNGQGVTVRHRGFL